MLNFFLERDLLFAQLTLDTDEFELYRHVYEQLAAKSFSTRVGNFSAGFRLGSAKPLTTTTPDT